jgi:hypothetical protein
MFFCSRPTVSAVRTRGRASTGRPDVNSKMGLTGRQPKLRCEKLRELIKLVPLRSRRTNRDSAVALGMSQTHFRYLMKRYRIFRAATLAAKPKLTQNHRTTLVEFVQITVPPE